MRVRTPTSTMGLADLALVRASVADDEFEWRGSTAEAREWDRALSAALEGEAAELAAPAHCAIHIAPGIWVNAQVSEGAPRVTISAAHLDTAQHARLSEVVARHMAEPDDMPLFNIIVELQEAAAECVGAVDAAQPAPAPPAPAAPEPARVSMARVIFWAHHLVAPSKRRELAAWAGELHVWTLLKLGYPGYLCFEGEAQDVADMAMRVRHMQWHALSLRTEESWVFDGTPDAALRACPLATGEASRTLRPGSEEITDMGEFVARLRGVLEEHQVVSALGLRTSSGSKN